MPDAIDASKSAITIDTSKVNLEKEENFLFDQYDKSVYEITGAPLVSDYYNAGNTQEWAAPPLPTDAKSVEIMNRDGVTKPQSRKALPSIFNRYSIFFYNNTISNSQTPESYIDSANRIDEMLAKVRLNPTARNLINWSQNGTTNAVEYAIEDFLWCKNYGQVPNNYMITLRRFPTPVEDDIFDVLKVPNPDIGRFVGWVDGTTNKWDTVGLKWTHGFNWKSDIKADVQTIDASTTGWGTDQASGLRKALSVLDTNVSKSMTSNPNLVGNEVGYKQNNAVYGPIDVINTTTVRDRGLTFEQNVTLVFEYKLKSIDGINPKIAFIDLLSNIGIVTSNRAPFWGGDVKYYGANPRRLKPLGKPEFLEKNDWGGYIGSVANNISNMFKNLGGGGGGFSWEKFKNIASGIGGNIMSQLAGANLDKMGRPGIMAIDSLLTGEKTGDWHLTIGNPANPIISIGNLVLESTDVEIYGALGVDDFPSDIKITCKLKPAMPRDRIDMMAMFHRNNRTYLTVPPTANKYAGNLPAGSRKNGGKMTTGKVDMTKKLNEYFIKYQQATGNAFDKTLIERFPNHTFGKNRSDADESAKLIG
jgi:hypothetical protein